MSTIALVFMSIALLFMLVALAFNILALNAEAAVKWSYDNPQTLRARFVRRMSR